MNAATLAGVAFAAASQSPVPGQLALGDAAQAIDAGRFDQARLMIAQASKAGANGAQVERLLADLAFAAGNNAEALARYRQLAVQASPDTAICEKAVIAALRIGAIKEASATIDCATSGPDVTWRSWNARGVLADIHRDWPEADSAYQNAARLMPAEPSVLNNRGWSFVLRGQWTEALLCFRQAV